MKQPSSRLQASTAVEGAQWSFRLFPPEGVHQALTVVGIGHWSFRLLIAGAVEVITCTAELCRVPTLLGFERLAKVVGCLTEQGRDVNAVDVRATLVDVGDGRRPAFNPGVPSQVAEPNTGDLKAHDDVQHSDQVVGRLAEGGPVLSPSCRRFDLLQTQENV